MDFAHALDPFWDAYRRRFGTVPLARVAPLEALLGHLAADAALTDLRQAAYLLATVHHETNATYLPVREAYWKDEAWRLRNLRYAPWYGRGFVQLTWERNYRRAGQALGLDLIADPDAAMEPGHAYRILSQGAREGWFTGKKLSDFINERATDYVGARKVINGTDRAAQVAGYAAAFEQALGALAWSAERSQEG